MLLYYTILHTTTCSFLLFSASIINIAINFSSADLDYDNMPAVRLQFEPFHTVNTVDIAIMDNPSLEPIELFFGELTTTLSTVVLDPQRASISIIDDDGKL